MVQIKKRRQDWKVTCPASSGRSHCHTGSHLPLEGTTPPTLVRPLLCLWALLDPSGETLAQEEMWPHVSPSYSLLRNLAGSSLKGTQREEEEDHLVLFLETHDVDKTEGPCKQPLCGVSSPFALGPGSLGLGCGYRGGIPPLSRSSWPSLCYLRCDLFPWR